VKTTIKDYNKKNTKRNVAISPYISSTSPNITTFLDVFLPFEPTLFPKLQVYFADFPYLRYTISPEAINLEDLMRLLVRHGLRIICIFFPQHIIFQGTKAIHSCRKKYQRLWHPQYSYSNRTLKNYSILKANKKYFSEQIKLNTFWRKNTWIYCYTQTLFLTLLYRKDNSALDCFCCYDVYLSCLYISRRNKANVLLHPPYSSPCTGILTCFLFNNQEYIDIKYIFPYWPFRTCFKIDLLLD